MILKSLYFMNKKFQRLEFIRAKKSYNNSHLLNTNISLAYEDSIVMILMQ